MIATIVTALACATGFQLIDWSARISPDYAIVAFVISVEPFYSRITIYSLDHPDERLPCCGNNPTSVITLPRGSGKFCVRQSQPSMKWKIRVVPMKQRVTT
jgi:hypothetical protein